MNNTEIEQIEVDLILEAIHQRYGYEFQEYSRASMRRRILHHLAKTEYERVSDLIPDILHNPKTFEALF